MADKHSYHLKLADGSERDVKADDAVVNDAGALVLTDHYGGLVAAYAPQAWTLCEPERRDDTG